MKETIKEERKNMTTQNWHLKPNNLPDEIEKNYLLKTSHSELISNLLIFSLLKYFSNVTQHGLFHRYIIPLPLLNIELQ